MLDQRIVEIIKEGKGFVAILAGSGSDETHIEKIVNSLESYQLPYGVNIFSAHKQTEKVKEAVFEYNKLRHPLLLVAVAGGTDALSGTASWFSYHPVVSSPPDGFNISCLTNPPGSSNAYIQNPEDLTKFSSNMFSYLNQGVTNIGANAVILYDKSSDKSQIEKIKKGLDSYGIKYVDYEIFKGIEDVLLKVYLGEYPPLIITVDSNINGLSNKNFDYPVVFCPQENFNLNELGSDNPNAVIKRPDNVVKFAAQMFSYMDDKYIHLLQRGIDKKSHELMEDNARINRKYLDRMLEIRTRGN